MKPPKNRTKVFRVDCVNCHATQDSLAYVCQQCKNRLYTNVEAEELIAVKSQISAMEDALDLLMQPIQKEKPYDPMDKAWEAYKTLKKYNFLPGMTAYLDRVLEILLPQKVALMKRTLKANWIFLFVLLAFPLVTMAFRLHWSLSILLGLPAIAWLFVTLKAKKDLQRTQEKLDQISTL